MTEDEIKKLVEDETAKQVSEYYRRCYPHFEVASGHDVPGHGESEYSLTTDSAQGIHFYDGGNMKTKANKTCEIYSGFDATDEEPAVHIKSMNGYIKIKADDALILEGKRIQINATGTTDEDGIFIDGGKRFNVDASNIQMDGDNSNIVAAEEMFIKGGADLSLYSDAAPVQISSGAESIFAGSVTDKIMNMLDKAKAFFGS